MVSYAEALGDNNKPTEKEKLQRKIDCGYAAAACLAKQNRHSSMLAEMAHFHASVH